MPRGCTICNSDLRAEIETMMVLGESTKSVAEWATSNGLKITHATVQRHKKHIDNFKPESKEVQGIDAETVASAEFTVDIPVFSDGDDLLNFTKTNARAILANQMVIVRAKQEKFMAGEGRYPSAEIQALKTLSSCLSDLTESKAPVYQDSKSTKQSTG